MPVDRQARMTLQIAIVAYMSGAIRTFAFEDQYSPCRDSPDESVRYIVRQIEFMHDFLVDHPISVGSDGWEALRRTVAFLGTDMELSTPSESGFWPFRDELHWHLNEHVVSELGLPSYDSKVHGCPANPWWNRIPTRVGVSLLLGILAVVFLILASL